MISLDTETTGLNLRHGAKPFLVTITHEDGAQDYWEWDVDPLTREPSVSRADLVEIQDIIDDADKLILQNPKFDYLALTTIFIRKKLRWDWGKVYDTLLAGHLLASGQKHDLATMAMVYLKVNIFGLEEDIQEACNKARRHARSKHPTWRIAKKGLPEMPSVKGKKVWKNDMWLPQAIAKKESYPKDHPWWEVCATYANGDSGVTLPLFIRQRELLEKRNLWKIYLERLKLLPVVSSIEDAGVTISGKRKKELERRFTRVTEKAKQTCFLVSDRQIEKLPISGASNALRSVLFDHFKLKSSRETPKGNPSVNKYALEDWVNTLPRRSASGVFTRNLMSYRKRMTALGYLESYRNFWLPTGFIRKNREDQVWYKLYPSLNATGSKTLRFSSQEPNEQQISKKEEVNLRYCFGPAPNREWWSADAENIELRIPAYESGEKAMIDIFERPNDPPFFGSYHLLVFSLLHPKFFKQFGANVKKKFASTWYQWVKNFNFADQYGAVMKEDGWGTADRAAHVPNAQALIAGKFKQKAKLNQKMIAFAQKHGYVETIPDKTVDPDHGYPLQCLRTRWGSVKPTLPLNYHVSGTAMWWMMRAMIACQNYLDKINKKRRGNYQIIMQVHDELVFDFPKGKTPKENLPIMKKLCGLMSSCGEGIGIPTPVSMDYHPNNWAETVPLNT